MNICLLTRTTLRHSMGGMEQHIRMLSEGLARKGHRVTLITTAHPDGKSERELSNGVAIHYLPGTVPGRYSSSFYKKSIVKFIELHEKDPFTIIHSQSGGGFAFLKQRISRKYHVPVVVTMHGIFYNELVTRLNILFSWGGSLQEKAKSFLLVFYYLFVYFTKDLPLIPKAEAVISTSSKQKKLMKKLYSLADHQLFLVHNGVDLAPKNTAASAPSKESLGLSRKNVLLCIARLKKEKGIHVAFAALPKVLVHHPDTLLVIVGDGEYRETLVQQARELIIEKNVLFIGTVPYDGLSTYYTAADIFINSTIRENGYDLTIVQAMGYEKPVVVTRLKSLEGVIEDGSNGILFSMGNSDELARHVTALLNDKAAAAALGKQAGLTYNKYFSAERMVENTVAVYEASQKAVP